MGKMVFLQRIISDYKRKARLASKGLCFTLVALKGFGTIRQLFEKADKIFLRQQNGLKWVIIAHFPLSKNGCK